MGIHNFHTFIKKKYPLCIKSKWKNHYDYIYIDINYCLHNIAYKAISLEDVIKKLTEYIKNILKNNIPLKEVILVTDGPAPFAKLFLQRQRRMGMITITNTDIESDNLTLNFTPGTNFMNTLANNLSDFIKYLKFIFSIDITLLFNEPNEGEIKIKKALLERCKDNSHLIVSNDADIVLLMACSKCNKNIFILTKMCINKEVEYYVINVNYLIEEHKKEFNSSNNLDLVGLSLLIGNDYLPKISYNNFDKLWDAYKYSLNLDNSGLILSINPVIINRDFLINILLGIIKKTNDRFLKLFSLQHLYHPLYDNYIEGYLWCIDMYSTGVCNNYDYIYKYQDDNIHPLGLIYSLSKYNEYIYYNIKKQIKNPIDKIIYCILLLPYNARTLIDIKYHKFLEEIKYIYSEEYKHNLLNIDDIYDIVNKFDCYNNLYICT